MRISSDRSKLIFSVASIVFISFFYYSFSELIIESVLPLLFINTVSLLIVLIAVVNILQGFGIIPAMVLGGYALSFIFIMISDSLGMLQSPSSNLFIWFIWCAILFISMAMGLIFSLVNRQV